MKIAVIGAGVSGLTFAAAMRRFAPKTQVELYERDLSAESQFRAPDGSFMNLLTLLIIRPCKTSRHLFIEIRSF